PSHAYSSTRGRYQESVRLAGFDWPTGSLALLIFFAFSISKARSSPSLRAVSPAARRSKYFFPSIQVCWQTARESRGEWDQSTKSASLPGSRLPTYWSMCNWRAGLIVTNLNASSSETPPYLTAFAASKFKRLERSEESELN